jgi:hypothetical protein
VKTGDGNILFGSLIFHVFHGNKVKSAADELLRELDAPLNRNFGFLFK